MAIKDYSTEPDMNTTISGINIAEGCAPSGINNAIRQLMADVKKESEAQEQAVSDIDALRSLIAEEVAKCLKLSGGKMEGNLVSVDGESVGKVVFIGTATDFDTLTVSGRYYLGYYAHPNSPNGGSINGFLVVSGQKDGTGYTTQTFYQAGAAGNTTCDIYCRKLVGGTWSPWYKLLTSAGGTLTGNLSFGCHSATEINSIELQPPSGSGHGGYIDFHFNGTAADYTSRIMENISGHLEINAPNGLGLDGQRVLTGADTFITGPASTSFTLPAGGTWRYLCVRTEGDTNKAIVGDAAGGTTVNFGHQYPMVFAVRIL